jgi:hypothetical protein
MTNSNNPDPEKLFSLWKKKKEQVFLLTFFLALVEKQVTYGRN